MSARKRNPSILILAAGKGTRMKSDLPKVLTPICGAPLISHILKRIQETQKFGSVGVVVGHGGDEVRKAIGKDFDVTFIEQPVRDGTGGAVRVAMEAPWGEEVKKSRSDVLVLPGDSPLLPRDLIEQMVEPLKKGHPIRMLTTEIEDPTGYGRILRKGKAVQGVVEHRDASDKQRLIKEIATSMYFFDVDFLTNNISKIKSNNAQNEYYLPDLVKMSVKAKKKIDVLKWQNEKDVRGINNLWELAAAEKILNRRILRCWAEDGVKFIDPDTTWIDVHAKLAPGVVVYPGVMILGASSVGVNSIIGPNSKLHNVVIGEETEVKSGTVAEDSSVGSRVKLGPYAHLRPGSEISDDAKIGNFVEVKKSKIGRGTSVAHLSYVGDAEIGQNVNIGCGFITCNFDGRVINGQRKHKTTIEDDVFMGSDCQAVAPIKIGKGAFIASGSTLTKDVPAGDLAVARGRQENKAGYAKRFRPKEK